MTRLACFGAAAAALTVAFGFFTWAYAATGPGMLWPLIAIHLGCGLGLIGMVLAAVLVERGLPAAQRQRTIVGPAQAARSG